MSRNYLVLGASSDVGIELINEINNKEHDATIWAHFCSNDISIKEIIPKNRNSIIPISADFSVPSTAKNLFFTIQKTGKMPSSIIHLPAPKLRYEKFKNLNWDDCISDVQIQVGSVFQLLQLLIPQIIKLEYKVKIVFMLSENTIHIPAKYSTKYTMSKFMLLGLMKSLVAEYSGKNININALSPSMIDTKLLSNIDRRLLEACGATEHILKPQDVVPWLWKLLSNYSDNMNGENILLLGENQNNE